MSRLLRVGDKVRLNHKRTGQFLLGAKDNIGTVIRVRKRSLAYNISVDIQCDNLMYDNVPFDYGELILVCWLCNNEPEKEDCPRCKIRSDYDEL